MRVSLYLRPEAIFVRIRCRLWVGLLKGEPNGFDPELYFFGEDKGLKTSFALYQLSYSSEEPAGLEPATSTSIG